MKKLGVAGLPLCEKHENSKGSISKIYNTAEASFVIADSVIIWLLGSN
jgi:hypothetical protein